MIILESENTQKIAMRESPENFRKTGERNIERIFENFSGEFIEEFRRDIGAWGNDGDITEKGRKIRNQSDE